MEISDDRGLGFCATHPGEIAERSHPQKYKFPNKIKPTSISFRALSHYFFTLL